MRGRRREVGLVFILQNESCSNISLVISFLSADLDCQPRMTGSWWRVFFCLWLASGRQSLQCGQVFLLGLGDDLVRQIGWGRCAVPVQGQEIVANELLVIARG
jgi:hypothetical protein